MYQEHQEPFFSISLKSKRDLIRPKQISDEDTRWQQMVINFLWLKYLKHHVQKCWIIKDLQRHGLWKIQDPKWWWCLSFSSPKAEFNYIQKSRISIVKVYSNLILASKHFAPSKIEVWVKQLPLHFKRRLCSIRQFWYLSIKLPTKFSFRCLEHIITKPRASKR